MAATTLPRALRIVLCTLAWGSLPMLGLTIASVFTFSPRLDRAIDVLMLLCGMCALSRTVQLHQDARIRAITDADNEQKRALIQAISDAAGPSTGPMRVMQILRDAS